MLLDWVRYARDFFFAQKYRFDLGIQFLVFVNFALLVVTASDKLKQTFGIPHTSDLLLVAIPLAFVGVWLVGYVLDRFVKSPQTYEREYLRRSPAWKNLFKELQVVRSELKAIRRSLSKR